MTANTIIEEITNFIFPTLCLSCKEKTDGAILCERCDDSIIIRKGVSAISDNVQISYATTYSNPAVRGLIHFLKYKSIMQASEKMASIVTEHMAYSGTLKSLSVENKVIIIPLPLHFTRKASRGFNQSEEISKAVSRKIGIPISTNTLIRDCLTSQQAKIGPTVARNNNVFGCFSLQYKKPHLRNWTVILIDDVMTSGATLREAIAALQTANPKKIIAITVAGTENLQENSD